MKIAYRREIKHNYLIIDPEGMEWNGYESQMLQKNSVDGLLNFSIRPTEEGVRFYYEITSKQPLTRWLQTRKIKAEEIRILIIGIFSVLERMEGYLLQEKRIILDPEFLYVDPDGFRIGLCLVPGLERDFTEDFSRLLEQILESVDHQDKESVALAYGLFQETKKENYGITDIMNFLSKHGHNGEQKPQEKSLEIRETQIGEVRVGERHIESAAIQKKVEQRDHSRSEQEHSGTKRQRSLWERLRSWFTSKFRAEQDEIPVRVPWEMMFQENEKETKDSEEFSEETLQEESNTIEQGTVLLADLTLDIGCRVLRALDTGEADIQISYYPFIIGKQEHLVDYCLNKDTVSRLHLKIDRIGEHYQIQDLNSTNGTMLNGKWMNNNETNEVRIGDEISIARYRYRFE